MSILTILTLIFITLKLTSYIDWSWFYVLAPTILHGAIWFAVQLWWESKTPEQKLREAYRRKLGL